MSAYDCINAMFQDDEHPELSAAVKLKIADILSPGEEAATAAAIREVERSTLQVPFNMRNRVGTKHGIRMDTFMATLLYYSRLRGSPACCSMYFEIRPSIEVVLLKIVGWWYIPGWFV